MWTLNLPDLEFKRLFIIIITIFSLYLFIFLVVLLYFIHKIETYISFVNFIILTCWRYFSSYLLEIF